jgi:hypothetical protein
MAATARLLALLATLVLLACGEDTPPVDDETPQPAHCNPLVGDRCLLPWPSSFYLAADAKTVTGYRVAYPQQAMPKTKSDVHLDPARYNQLDGFSIGSQLLVSFKDGVGAEGLPSLAALAGSQKDSSLISILDMKDGTRVPLFAELDANGKPEETPVLTIRPQTPLEWNRRYAVVLRVGMRDRKGVELAPPAPFRRLRDKLGTRDPTLQKEATRIEEVLAFLEGKGIARSSMLLAWDFHTASRERVTANLTGMVETALAKIPAAGPAVAITSSVDRTLAEDANQLREIEGTFEVPSFLASDDPDAWLKLDADGKPVYRAPQKFPFTVNVPRCAETATAPLPILIFGPGLFSSTKELLSDLHKGYDNRFCMLGISTNWIGLSDTDLVSLAQQVITEFSNLPRITDRLQQAHVNMHTLARLAKSPSLLERDELKLGGKPISDGKQVYFLGISNGGIQGVAFAALNRDIDRFIFNVSAGWWSMMMQRSSNFALLKEMLAIIYPDAVERAELISLSQHLWDYTDPISFGRFLLREPLPGLSKRQILLQEGRDDDQVPNLATRAVARAIGLAHLGPVVQPVFGLDEKSAPLESAYVQWDMKIPNAPPAANIPAPKPKPEESAHYLPRNHEACIKQMEAFLKTAKVISTCSGACDPD